MAEQIAKMQSVVKVLKSGDNLHLGDEEITDLKQQIISTASGHMDDTMIHLDDAQIKMLQDEIASTIEKKKTSADAFMFNPVPFMHMP